MKKSTIFQSVEEMPPKSNSPDVVRSAQTRSDVMAQNYVPSTTPTNRDVENLERPRRGHGY
jgi:hypothetical protein